MKQDVSGYFITVDESGKSEMDYFVEKPMDFGKKEVLPVCPEPPKVIRPAPTRNGNTTAKRWVPTKPKPISSTIRNRQVTSTSYGRAGVRPPVKSVCKNIPFTRPKVERFIREDLRHEVSVLELEELALCKDDDFGMTFDLEL
jgi:hypothetical protein